MVSPTAEAARPGRADQLRIAAQSGRRWLRAFRRTRPFWGGLWLLVGGWLVLRISMVSMQVVVASGMTGFGGWLTGGGMILCGLTAWFAPSQRFVTGVVGIFLAIASLIVSNLGGWFLGMLFGIVGGAMTLSWGAKPAKRPRSGNGATRLGYLAYLGKGALPAEPVQAEATSPRPAPGARPRPRPAASGSVE
jgi:hypothetical protein